MLRTEAVCREVRERDREKENGGRSRNKKGCREGVWEVRRSSRSPASATRTKAS